MTCTFRCFKSICVLPSSSGIFFIFQNRASFGKPCWYKQKKIEWLKQQISALPWQAMMLVKCCRILYSCLGVHCDLFWTADRTWCNSTTPQQTELSQDWRKWQRFSIWFKIKGKNIHRKGIAGAVDGNTHNHYVSQLFFFLAKFAQHISLTFGHRLRVDIFFSWSQGSKGLITFLFFKILI